MAGAAAQSGIPRGPDPAKPEEACGWRCPEHRDRAAELYCRLCRRCVCALCPVLGAHRGHPISLAVEEAAHVQVGTRRRACGAWGRACATGGPLCQCPGRAWKPSGPEVIQAGDPLFRTRN